MVHVWSQEHASVPFCIGATELFYLSPICLTQNTNWSPIRPILAKRLLLGLDTWSSQIAHLAPWSQYSKVLPSNTWEGTCCKSVCHESLDATSSAVPGRLTRKAGELWAVEAGGSGSQFPRTACRHGQAVPVDTREIRTAVLQKGAFPKEPKMRSVSIKTGETSTARSGKTKQIKK